MLLKVCNSSFQILLSVHANFLSNHKLFELKTAAPSWLLFLTILIVSIFNTKGSAACEI